MVTGSQDQTARVWDAHLLTAPVKDLILEACTRKLRGISTLTRDEMRLASYPDDMAEIDVCAGAEQHRSSP